VAGLKIFDRPLWRYRWQFLSRRRATISAARRAVESVTAGKVLMNITPYVSRCTRVRLAGQRPV